jgi:hypothetical protein
MGIKRSRMRRRTVDAQREISSNETKGAEFSTFNDDALSNMTAIHSSTNTESKSL